jgi:hypothetical protein
MDSIPDGVFEAAAEDSPATKSIKLFNKTTKIKNVQILGEISYDESI